MIDSPARFMIITLLFLQAACFGLALKKPQVRSWLPLLLLGLVVVELAVGGRYAESFVTKLVDVGMIERGDYYFEKKHTKILADLRERDSGFFRVERDVFSGGLNDSLVQKYFGVTGYVSISSGLEQFYNSLGVVKGGRRISSYRYGLGERLALHSLLGVKYYLSTESQPFPGYRRLARYDDISLDENLNFLPLGTLYYQQVPADLFARQDIAGKDRLLLEAVVTDENLVGLPSLSPALVAEVVTKTSVPEITASIEQLRAGAWNISEFQESRLSGEVKAPADGLLFCSIPYNIGWRATVDGREVSPLRVDFGFLGIPLAQGRHEVELTFVPPGKSLGPLVTLLVLALVLLVNRFVPLVRL